MRLGISSCLLGLQVRYDGQHKLDTWLRDVLGPHVEWISVCPEVECGLSVPREAMRLVDTPDGVRLVTIGSGIDHTERMLSWARRKLDELEPLELCGFVWKSKSPSSGMERVKVYPRSGGAPRRNGSGLFARAFMERFPLVPVEDDGRLQDDALRENFIERIFAFARWKEMMRGAPGMRELLEFHTRHKLLVMAHSPTHLRRLGALVSGNPALAAEPGSGRPPGREELLDRYIRLFMEALSLIATVKKNTNVLQHIMGYFRTRLSPDEKQELLEIIGKYHDGLIPLVVPMTLLSHYVRKYGEEYLAGQYYLHPHPDELMLRNHV